MSACVKYPFFIVVVLILAVSVSAQDFNIFFPAGTPEETTDRFGNTYKVGPADAIESEDLDTLVNEGVFFEEDGKWLVYPYEGDLLLLSHGPGMWEDAPEVTMEITLSHAGTYRVTFNFLESNSAPGTGPIFAALGDADLELYNVDNSERRSGGTSPAVPFSDGGTGGSMFWYSAVLGEVEVQDGETITIRVDDVPGDQYQLDSPMESASTFHGVTLTVLEGGPPLPEIQVSPGVFEWFTDKNGHQYKTWPADEAAYPTQEDWLTITTRQDGSGMWNIRQNLGTFGPILESFPRNGNDAMPLRTSVIFAEAGTYQVYLRIGDTAAAEPQQNLDEPNPLLFGIEGQEIKSYHPNDGEFQGTPGYNDYEIAFGQISVDAGEQVNFIIDDDQEYPNVYRSVYLGLRIVQEQATIESWSLH